MDYFGEMRARRPRFNVERENREMRAELTERLVNSGLTQEQADNIVGAIVCYNGYEGVKRSLEHMRKR